MSTGSAEMSRPVFCGVLSDKWYHHNIAKTSSSGVSVAIRIIHNRELASNKVGAHENTFMAKSEM